LLRALQLLGAGVGVLFVAVALSDTFLTDLSTTFGVC
jgi:hypothetical protein